MKKNILVFPCGSEVGLNIYSSVRYSRHFHLIGASSIEDHGAFVYEDYIPSLPFINEPSFIPILKSVIIDRKIDAIYPAMDSVIPILKSKETELGCKVVSSPLETTEICLSKSKTYNTFREIIRVPKLFSLETMHGFPVFVKPDIGYGARDTAIVEDTNTLNHIVSSKKGLLILEYLPGKEYTVDCFTDRNGKLIYAASRERNRIRNGISVNTFFSEKQEEFTTLAETINKRLLFRGAWFFQVKRDTNGELCLLEIASRLGGSSLLSRAIGVNLALLSLFDAFDIDIVPQINHNYHVVLDRALENKFRCSGLEYNTIYVDYDDCLVLSANLINVNLIRFLFDCINRGKKIVLLTKHRGDLYAEMRLFRIEHLFDEIILLSDDEEKYEYITDRCAIFIDDSFSERQRIKEKTGIPVFGPDMIDVLYS